MAIGVTGGLQRLRRAGRPQYGDPYPEGFAVASLSQTGDGSGGQINFAVNSDGGFLFRLEILQLVRGSGTTVDVDILTSHRWAEQMSGLGNGSLDHNWELRQDALATFSIYTLKDTDRDSIRRFPMGRTEKVSAQSILALNLTNVTGVTHILHMVCSYWRKEALYQPGFMSTFMEAPEVPAILRP